MNVRLEWNSAWVIGLRMCVRACECEIITYSMISDLSNQSLTWDRSFSLTLRAAWICNEQEYHVLASQEIEDLSGKTAEF